jgi:hypothetical protein
MLASSSLIQAASDCAAACDLCASSCIRDEHAEKLRECIRLDLDCADLCRLVASLAARDSGFVTRIAHDLAEVCDACATECSKHEQSHTQQCALACHRCATACRVIAMAV